MKGCPACGRLYPDDAGFCPVDGRPLTSATDAPVAADGQDRRLGHLVAERYELRRVVANGAMGRVYEALDRLDRCNVAVKILHDEVAGDDIAVERFRREFRVNSLLAHDHIVRVIDFVPTHDKSHALVMEFLYGEELSATLRRNGKLSPARVVRMLSQLALALDNAHARKLVHRDLKPDNLFLCQGGEGDCVKILDFGSVKDKGRSAKNLTVMGTTIGSPFYMAPEQAQGLPTLDHRADVWALAVICFECLTGQVPFTGANAPSILVRILQQTAPVASAMARHQGFPIPVSVDAVFARALSKQPHHRPDSVGELADELGVAYSLRGTHAEWATEPESFLRERIELGILQLQGGESLGPRDRAEEGFFGQGNTLDEVAPLVRPGSPARVEALARMARAPSRSASVETEGAVPTSLELPIRRQWPLLLAAACVMAAVVTAAWLVF